MKAMKVLFLLLALGLACAARAQEKRETFDPSMSVGETVAWLGRQLGGSRKVASADGRFRQHVTVRVVEAKGCSLSYVSESQSESSGISDPTAAGARVRELWTIDLAGLDPEMVRPAGPARVLFNADGAKQDAIRTNVFREQSGADQLTVRGNRRASFFVVADKKAEEVAEALRHAVALCRR